MCTAAVAGGVLYGLKDQAIYAHSVEGALQLASPPAAKKSLRIEATLVRGSLQKRAEPCEYRFLLSNGGATLPVRYPKCIVPDTFRDVPEAPTLVTVEGKMVPTEGFFLATSVLAKCPSKYETRSPQTR